MKCTHSVVVGLGLEGSLVNISFEPEGMVCRPCVLPDEQELEILYTV